MFNEVIHRWRFYRFIRILAPALFLVLVLSLFMDARRRAGVHRIFGDDAAYADLAVARQLVEARTYGLRAGEQAIAGFDAGWRLLLAAGGLTGDPIASGYLLNLLFSLIILMAVMRMARLLFPFPPFSYLAVAFLILSPGLVCDALSGTSASMAACLVTVAALLHLEGIRGARKVLPMSAAVLLGIAVWLRLEFVLVWLVFYLHALVLSLIPYDKRPRPGATFFRGINGLLLIGLFLLPLLAWNMWVIQVPWPRLPGVPMAMDAWAHDGPSVAYARMMEWVGSGWPEARARFGAVPALAGGVSRLFVVIGLLLMVGLSCTESENRPYTLLLFVFLLLPLLYALVYPYAGWFGVDRVMGSFHPLLAVAAAYGVVRLPFAVEQIFLKWKPQTPTAHGFRIWWGLAGGLLLLVGLVQGIRENRSEVRHLQRLEDEREHITRVLERKGLFRDTFITDEPGWLAHEHELPLIDLSGRFSRSVLLCVDGDGTLDAERLHALFQRRMPGGVVLWNHELFALVRDLPDMTTLIEPDEDPYHPWVAMITWPGVL